MRITPSEICRILHILRKPNSIIALLFIQNTSPLFVFLHTKDNTISSPGFFGQWFNNLQRAALLTSFWRHQFNNFRQAACVDYGDGPQFSCLTQSKCGVNMRRYLVPVSKQVLDLSDLHESENIGTTQGFAWSLLTETKASQKWPIQGVGLTTSHEAFPMKLLSLPCFFLDGWSRPLMERCAVDVSYKETIILYN